ncbi:ornithine cyclodeaminase [Hyphomicrobiales bacterium 4NK60-0047b]|jgi:ornithine cyclodeaminase
MKFINRETVAGKLNWLSVLDTLREGHLLPKADISDQFLVRKQDTLLSRAAWIDGLGFGVKSVSVMANNLAKGLPSVQGAMLVFEDRGGKLEAVIDSSLVTEWKTAGDSVLGAKLLARQDSENYLVVGAGVVAENLIHSYSEVFPNLKSFEVWNRTPAKADALANKMTKLGIPVQMVTNLKEASNRADIISTATMTRSPLLYGDWITPGTHVDLIGAFKKDMREADDTLLQKGQIFVDSFETTISHIGELMIPLLSGAITRNDILSDFYDLVNGQVGRTSSDEITVFKNGGGAHLDLMVAKYILKATA